MSAPGDLVLLAMAGLGVTVLFAAVWGALAWLAAEAWRKRCAAVETQLRLDRRKRSEATAKGNRTRAERNRARIHATTEEIRRAVAARQAGDEPELPGIKGSQNG